MILALDVGNTNIVMGCIEDGEIISTVRTRTENGATWAEYAIRITDFLSLLKIDLKQIEGSVISSVVPPVTEALIPAVENLFGVTPIVVNPFMNCGIGFNVDEPSTVAGDLICSSVGAVTAYGAPCIIVDLGTATTITVVDKDSNFIGAAIMPGVRTGLNALSAKTSLLPEIAISAPEKAIGKNTVDCMRSGVVIGTACMLDGMIDRFTSELGYDCTLIATGGLASSIVEYCTHDIICDDDLLLKGLWVIYNKSNN